MLEKLTKITPSDVVKVIFLLKRFRRSNVPCIAGRGFCDSWGLPVVEIAGSRNPICRGASAFLNAPSLAQI